MAPERHVDSTDRRHHEGVGAGRALAHRRLQAAGGERHPVAQFPLGLLPAALEVQVVIQDHLGVRERRRELAEPQRDGRGRLGVVREVRTVEAERLRQEELGERLVGRDRGARVAARQLQV
jgi:hypothetical protein